MTDFSPAPFAKVILARLRQERTAPEPKSRAPDRATRAAVCETKPSPFAHLYAARVSQPQPAPAQAPEATAAGTAEMILRAGAMARGELSWPAPPPPATSEDRKAAATAARIIDAGRRRRGETT